MSVLSGVVLLIVVASVLALRPTGTEVEFYGDSEGDRKAVIVLDSTDFIEMRGATLADRGDFRAGPEVARAKTESRGRMKRPASSWPVREPGDDGEYVDPLADRPVAPLGGGVSYVGEFQDPDHDVPMPLPDDGIWDVGDYLAPEEGP